MKIAVLDTDTYEAQSMEKVLQAAGHTAKCFPDENTLVREYAHTPFDLILVGVGIAEAGGRKTLLALCKQLPAQVLLMGLLTVNIENEVVAALNAGADDCMVKPVRYLELLARIDAVARRARVSAAPALPKIELGGLRVDLRNRMIFRNNERLTLTPKTYDLAVLMLTHTGQLLSRAHLLEKIWGHGRPTSARTLDTHVSRLRAVLGLTADNGWKLQSVYQHGYRLDRLERLESFEGDGLAVFSANTPVEVRAPACIN